MSTPSAQPSPEDLGSVPPTVGRPSRSAVPSSTEPSNPALPIPSRPAKPSPPGTTTVSGTIAYGVEPNCVLLNGYLLIGGPRELFTPGALVTVTGRVDVDLVSTCQQGTPMVVIDAKRG